MMTLTEAKRIVGSIGYPSKMPGTSYGLPARACILGSKLAKVPGTVCGGCYALRGQYRISKAQIGQEKRLASLEHPFWVGAMVRLLNHIHSKPRIRVDLGMVGVRRQRAGGERFRWNEPGFHRWHDSGDLQSIEHLGMICAVAMQTPKIWHWLPTNELAMVKAYLKTGEVIPYNLVIRVSSIHVNDTVRRAWPWTSSVFNDDVIIPSGHICPAACQGHECKKCRACWSPDVEHVSYPIH